MIHVGNQRGGIIGLEEIFNQWSAREKTPSSLEEDEVIQEIRNRNYVCDHMEREYVDAVRTAYARLYDEKKGTG
jgi:hypothetical protein